MSDKLQEICTRRARDVAAAKARVSQAELVARIADAPPTSGFRQALVSAQAAKRPGLIAEVKQASPSQGIIRAGFDPVAIAQDYAAAGADCLSVLTEPHYFKGDDAYLAAIRQAVPCPLLRKDFTVDAYQVYESRALGADCILLIMAALDDSQARDYHALATGLGLDVLVEVHDLSELERAAAFAPDMIGVNNRNLKTLLVDVNTSVALAPHMPTGTLCVAESGIKSADEIRMLQTHGYTSFLVGESLLRQGNVAEAVKKLLAPI